MESSHLLVAFFIPKPARAKATKPHGMKEAQMAEELNQEEAQEQQEPHGDERPQIDWKAEARKWEGRSKENAERLKSIESEHEQSKARLDELAKRAEKAEQEADDLRKQKELADTTMAVGEKYGIPAEIVALLKGETGEELEGSAEKLRAWLPTAPVVKDSGKPTGEKLVASDKTKFVKNLFSN